ncbi:hypothetical protein AAFF_G00270470 [Aldrovandia affinis]|uniref:MHC class I-like antigen recognition-like domain-containing protein n=1 Tax=Aldrovandia affinis TaxID=143900 RepID=A0AAD7W1M8_9TELE|nr:hypothetical protein AAFF_G00270470 [Aldrovandia affinis]
MGKVLLLGVMLCCINDVSAATHSLKYFETAVTAGIDFPEYTLVGLVDEEPFVYYDSKIKKMIPKTEWMEKSEDQQYWGRETQKRVVPS